MKKLFLSRFIRIKVKGMVLAFLFTAFLFITNCTEDANKSDLLFYKDSEGIEKPVKTLIEWEQKRKQILDSMQAAMGELPDRSNLPPFDIHVIDSLKDQHYTRYTINFTVAEQERLPAYLYVPIRDNTEEKLPAMLALHGTASMGKGAVDGQGELSNRAYAKELAQRGYVVIAPDYPSMGDLKDYDFKTDRYQSGTMKSIFDNMRCVDLLQTRADVDPERIGVIGHSLGGHNSMFVGAFDTRLKVVVSSCGWTLFDYDNLKEADDYIKRYGGRLGDWAKDVYMPLLREKYNLDPDSIPFDFDEVIAAIAPRAFFSNSPLKDEDFDAKGVKAGIASALNVYRFFGAEDKLQVRYPDSKHDFPTGVRLEAYQFIDKILGHIPNHTEIK